MTTQQQSDPALNLYQTHWRTTVLLYDQIPYLHDMLADYETNPEIDEYIAGMRAFLIHWLLALLSLCDRARFLGLSLDEGLTTSIEQTIDALRAVEKTFFECPLPASEPPLPPNKQLHAIETLHRAFAAYFHKNHPGFLPLPPPPEL